MAYVVVRDRKDASTRLVASVPVGSYASTDDAASHVRAELVRVLGLAESLAPYPPGIAPESVLATRRAAWDYMASFWHAYSVPEGQHTLSGEDAPAAEGAAWIPFCPDDFDRE